MQKRVEKSKIYATALEEIERKRGKVTAQTVVEEARDETHVLHGEFDWDDSSAANQWRLAQAREIIRAARIEITVDDISFSAIAYVRDPLAEPSDAGYQSVRNLANDRASSIEAVACEIRQAAALLRRSRDVAMSLGIDVVTIQELEAAAESLAARLASTISATENVA